MMLALSVTCLNGMVEQFQKDGFCELPNTQYTKEDFSELYKSFDAFVDQLSDNEELSVLLKKSEQTFIENNALKKRYCGAPPSYRNPLRDTQKRHNKVYFQYINEYHDLVKQHYPELLKSVSIAAFFKKFDEVDALAKEQFKPIIAEFEKKHPGITKALYGAHKDLTIVNKIVRYVKTDNWGTTPHFDKSSLTFVWDSNDPDNDSLLISDNYENPTMDSLKKPVRLYAKQDGVSSTLLIAGSCFNKIGIPIKPTLHGVAPIKNDVRHAVISFALIPDINTSDLQTDFVEPTK